MMDILNLVISLLNLLVTLVAGVIPITWMIAKDVFQERKYDAKHYSTQSTIQRKSKTTASSYQLKRSFLLYLK